MSINDGGWRPDGTGVQPGGNVGGDVQRGDSYSVRFHHPALSNALITRTAYASEYDRNPGDFYVQVETELLICDDLADPGGTETWSDVIYSGSDTIYDTAEAAEREARLVVAPGFLDEAGSIDWDGEPW